MVTINEQPAEVASSPLIISPKILDPRSFAHSAITPSAHRIFGQLTIAQGDDSMQFDFDQVEAFLRLPLELHDVFSEPLLLDTFAFVLQGKCYRDLVLRCCRSHESSRLALLDTRSGVQIEVDNRPALLRAVRQCAQEMLALSPQLLGEQAAALELRNHYRRILPALNISTPNEGALGALFVVPVVGDEADGFGVGLIVGRHGYDEMLFESNAAPSMHDLEEYLLCIIRELASDRSQYVLSFSSGASNLLVLRRGVEGVVRLSNWDREIRGPMREWHAAFEEALRLCRRSA